MPRPGQQPGFRVTCRSPSHSARLPWPAGGLRPDAPPSPGPSRALLRHNDTAAQSGGQGRAQALKSRVTRRGRGPGSSPGRQFTLHR